MRLSTGSLASRIFCNRAFSEQKLLGVGLFGETALSKENKSGKLVAIKRLTSVNSRKTEELFMNEFAIIANVSHPCILPFLGFITSSHHSKIQPAIVSVYMKNGSLDHVLKKSSILKKWTLKRRIKVLVGIAHAMIYLHKKNIIHRDLKPANILLNENYEAFVSDFGLSQFIPKREVGGTPLYLAPEIIRNQDINQKVDVYSFAIIMYQLLTGEKPFNGEKSVMRLMERAERGERPEIPNNLPKELSNLIQKCWSNNPDDRPSFEEILDILISNNYDGVQLNESDSDNETNSFEIHSNDESSSNENVEEDIDIKQYSNELQKRAKNYKYKEETTCFDVILKILGCRQIFTAIWFLIRIMQSYGLTFSNSVDSIMSDAGPVFSWFHRFADKLANAIFGTEEFSNAQMLAISSCPIVLTHFFVSFAGRKPYQNGIIQLISTVFLGPLCILIALLCYGYRKWWIYVLTGLHLLIVITYAIFRFILNARDDYENTITKLFFVFSFPTSFYIDLLNFFHIKYNYFAENTLMTLFATIFTTAIIIFMTKNIAFGVIVAIICIILYIAYAIYRQAKHFGIDKKSIDKSFVSTVRKLYLILQTIIYIPASEFIFECIKEDKANKEVMTIPLLIYALIFTILVTILFLIYFSYRAILYRNMLNPYCFRFIMNNCSTFLGFNCSDLKARYLWFEPIDCIVRFIFAGFTVYSLNWYALGLNSLEGLFVIIARPYLCPSDNILYAGEMIVLAVANGFAASELGGHVFSQWYAYLIVAIAFAPLVLSLLVYFIFEVGREQKFIDKDIRRMLDSYKTEENADNNLQIFNNKKEFNATTPFTLVDIDHDEFHIDENDKLGMNFSGTRMIALVEDDPKFQRFYRIIFQKSHLLIGTPLVIIYLFWVNLDKMVPL